MIALLLGVAFAREGVVCEAGDVVDAVRELSVFEYQLAAGSLTDAAPLADKVHNRLLCLDSIAPAALLQRYAQARATLAFLQQDDDAVYAWAGGMADSDDAPAPVVAAYQTLSEDTYDGPAGGWAGFTWVAGTFRAKPSDASHSEGWVLVQRADKKGVVVDAKWVQWPAVPDAFASADAPPSKDPLIPPTPMPNTQPPRELGCAMTATEFTEMVAWAVESAEDDDLEGHAQVYADLQKKGACLQEPVPRGPWADYLLAQTLAEFAQGQRWEEPHTSLMWLAPQRRYDLPDKISTVPTPKKTHGAELPRVTPFLVDGVPVRDAMALPGLHLVQRLVAGRWETEVVRAGSFPEAWLEEPPEAQAIRVKKPKDEAATAVRVGALVGYGSRSQSTTVPHPDLRDVSQGGGVGGVVAEVTVPVGPLRLDGDLALPWQVTAVPAVDGAVTGGLQLGPVAVFGGLGVSGTALEEAQEPAMILLPHPRLGVEARGGPVTARLDLGATTASQRVGIAARIQGDGDAWVGVRVLQLWTQFAEPSTERIVNANRTQAAITGGWTFD